MSQKIYEIPWVFFLDFLILFIKTSDRLTLIYETFWVIFIHCASSIGPLKSKVAHMCKY